MSEAAEVSQLVDEVWRHWHEQGHPEGEALDVDFRAYCTSQVNADRVRWEFESRALETEVRAKRTLLFFRGWLVKGHENRVWTLEDLRARVLDIVQVCERKDAVFDGFGAVVGAAKG